MARRMPRIAGHLYWIERDRSQCCFFPDGFGLGRGWDGRNAGKKKEVGRKRGWVLRRGGMSDALAHGFAHATVPPRRRLRRGVVDQV